MGRCATLGSRRGTRSAARWRSSTPTTGTSDAARPRPAAGGGGAGGRAGGGRRGRAGLPVASDPGRAPAGAVGPARRVPDRGRAGRGAGRASNAADGGRGGAGRGREG